MSTETRVLVTRINCFLFSIVKINAKFHTRLANFCFIRSVAKKFPGGSIKPCEASGSQCFVSHMRKPRSLPLRIVERKTLLRADYRRLKPLTCLLAA